MSLAQGVASCATSTMPVNTTRPKRELAMPRRWSLLLILIVMLVAQPKSSLSQPSRDIAVSSVTTAELAQACSNSPSNLAFDFCTGYILGVFDRLSFSRAICPVGNSITAHAIALARKSLNDDFAHWPLHPSVFLANAFAAAFPCGKNSN